MLGHGRRGASGVNGQSTGQISEDAADAIRVQAGPRGDFVQWQSLAFEAQKFAVFRGAKIEQLLPEIIGLDDLARAVSRRGTDFAGPVLAERLFAFDGTTVLPAAVDEAVAGYFDKESAEVVGVRETPPAPPKPVKEIGPDRLYDVGRVELGPEPTRQPSPDDLSENRLIVSENPLGGRMISA
jgi:hypothetical protein